MPISALLHFQSDGDALKKYDAIVDEMGVQTHPAKGAVYHWCAPAPGGLRICDAWETREDFDRFARDKIGPITAKHGLSAPAVEVTDIHEIILGHATSRQGTGVIIEADGDQQTLLKTIDEANKKMQTNDKPPQGLICHWTTTRDGGIRVIDHWRSREDFDTFANSILGPTLKALNMPPARFEFFDVHNSLDPRVAAPV